MINSKLPKIWYGGDYNPDQWDKSIWPEDMRMFQLAGIDVATLNVFAWALNQPDEETYQLDWLDEMMDLLYKNGKYVCLATSTAAHPAWMATRYPDVLRVDFEGRKHKFGQRHNSCPNSPTYRKYSRLMVAKLAERYKDHPALIAWHVSNEYGGECYCDNCAAAFRAWLQQRYGTLEKVNQVWNTNFWGHTFYDWEEIVPPNALSEGISHRATAFQGISLDYARFNSDGMLDNYIAEYNEIKKHTPDVPVTTNLMGTYKPLDYFKWAKHLNVISWDSYPRIDTPVGQTAMVHDLMRGLKNGQPFMLMEQTPSQQNWAPYNALKRPGVMRLWSYQAVARGADTVMFFQLRRSVGACEKYHGAVIEHVGHEHTRVFRECAQLGDELGQLSDQLLDAVVPSRVAIVFDWENWWAVEYSSGPSAALQYVSEVYKYYQALYRMNIQTDMIGVDTDLSSYEVVIAPLLYMIKPGYADKVNHFVEQGGTFITTFFSGIVNENDIVTLGGYPGELRPLLGIWAEEIDALMPGQKNRIVMNEQLGSLNVNGEYTCELLCDLIHAEGAEVVATYGADFYKGMPVVTRNRYGQGQAWYVASSPDQLFLTGLLESICADKSIVPTLVTPEGVEATRREKNGVSYLFLLNHTSKAQFVDVGSEEYTDMLAGLACSGSVTVDGNGVRILRG
ncbi:MAG: beta-galactosidase [Paenibacillaceae bacterium]